MFGSTPRFWRVFDDLLFALRPDLTALGRLLAGRRTRVRIRRVPYRFVATVPSDRARALVNQALQRPPDSRLEFLRSVCGPDKQLLLETSELLGQHSEDRSDPASSAGAYTTLGAGERVVGRNVRRGAFTGTDRFSLTRRLGSGGFGVVYEALDRVRETVVALKVLQNVTPDALYRFKREFRLLADVHHPNLVQLHELFSHEGHWFFTMELVNGRNFLSYVGAAQTVLQTPPVEPPAVDRLVGALHQLVEGLSALHGAGHVHRDVKPTNVLVTPEGRVVLLDFGLLLDLADESGWQSFTIAGTPLYMAPEQAAGLPVTPASDWYSVGVMLYQALTGRVPFQGTYLEILQEKQHTDPPPPATIVERVPPHLDALCRELLDRDVSRRPSAEQILERLALQRPNVARERSPRSSSDQRRFIGRHDARRNLLEAFQRVVEGTPTVVAVAGPSGIGKSALVHAVLADIRRASPTALVLSGRCYQRESVPYKALDSIVDALARHLRGCPAMELQAVLPRDVASMAQVFPALAALSDQVRHRVTIPVDAHEVRRRAWAGLRETLARIADRRPLVLFVDDLQWGDSDSATLLADLLRPRDAPVLLFIGAHRDVDVDTSAFLRPFYAEVLGGRQSHTVSLRPLSPTETEALAAALLPPALATEDIVSLIATESGGSPFFVDELVRFAEASGTLTRERRAGAGSDEREATLAHMIVIRQARLPQLAQQLLQLIAVNAKPLPEHVLRAAANETKVDAALSVLQAEHFVRAREVESIVEVEAYHDRIREVVSAALEPAVQREHHRRLARAWEQEATADPELVAEHWHEAGDRDRAARFSKLAAEQADRALAFDRAARLYQRALDLDTATDVERGAIMVTLGRALANAGRGAQAAGVYLNAPAFNVAETLDLRMQAAQQYLFAGHMVDGLAVIRGVLDEIGMALPSSGWRTRLELLRGRAVLRMRGFGFREKPIDEVSPLDLMKVDACWSVAAGLSIVDAMRGAVFQSRHLLLALRLGELQRIHRALCLEVGFVAAAGSRGARRAAYVRKLTTPLTHKLGTPYATAMHALMEGVNDYLLGNWKRAVGALTSAEDLFATTCRGVTWELDSTRFFRMWSHYQLGDLQTLKSRFPVLLKDAQERGDLYASATISGLFAHIVYLADADPAAAAKYTREAIASWAQPGFHMPNLWGLWSETDIAIYECRGADAWDHIQRAWGPLRRSLLLEVQMIRISMLDLKGRAALAAACQSGSRAERDRLLRVVDRCATAMSGQHVQWASALALMLRAGIASARAERDEAIASFSRAHEALEAVDMALLATVAALRHGQLTGGTRGRTAIEEATAWMRAQGIEQPEAMTQMFAPR